MAFSIGGHSFSLSAMLGSAEKKPAAQDPARPAPPAQPAAAGAAPGHAGRFSGSGLAHSLRKKLAKTKSASGPAPQGSLADGLRAALQTATRKFCRDAQPIQHALAGWCGDEEASLEATLNPFNKPRSGLAPGVDKNDGLRSGVTGMLEGLSKADCDAPAALKERARALKDAVLFKRADGKEVRLIAFATPGEAGTAGIDALHLSLPDRRQVATRFAAALHDMGALGAAYGRPGTPLPPMRFVPDAVLVVGPPAQNPASGLQRKPALRYPAGRPQALATPPAPVPTPVRGLPSAPPRRASADAAGIDMDRLFADARSHLAPEEFDKVARGELDLMDMVGVIRQRVQLNAPGGDFLPAYKP